MAYEVKIYGDIVSKTLKGCCSLVEVQDQLTKAGGQDIKVRIKSNGGDVYEGFAIYSELRRYASENKARITTMAEGQCASIATIIFLAGDERIVSKYMEPFVHNALVTDFTGNSKEMRDTAGQLDKIDALIAQHYADHTNIHYNKALELMGADTSLEPIECVKLRFATKVESLQRPLALRQVLEETETDKENYKPEFDMNFKDKKERLGFLNSIASSLGIKVKGFSNKIVKAADDTEIDFFELEADEPIEVGASATISGKPAEGTWTMPKKEDGTAQSYNFENGTLTEIVDLAADDTDIEALKAELEALKADNETLNAEAESTAEVLNALNEKYEEAVKEKNVFQAQAKALQTKVNGAKSVTVVDLKEKNEPETKSEVSSAILAYKESKFKTKK